MMGVTTVLGVLVGVAMSAGWGDSVMVGVAMSAGWGDLVMMDVAMSAGVGGWVWLWMTISYQLTKAQYNAVLGCAWWVWFCVGCGHKRTETFARRRCGRGGVGAGTCTRRWTGAGHGRGVRPGGGWSAGGGRSQHRWARGR